MGNLLLYERTQPVTCNTDKNYVFLGSTLVTYKAIYNFTIQLLCLRFTESVNNLDKSFLYGEVSICGHRLSV